MHWTKCRLLRSFEYKKGNGGTPTEVEILCLEETLILTYKRLNLRDGRVSKDKKLEMQLLYKKKVKAVKEHLRFMK